MAAYDQIRIEGINKRSGIYQIRLNFDNNPLWTTAGQVISVNGRQALNSWSTFKSSQPSSELAHELDNVTLALNDMPDLKDTAGNIIGNIFRDSFEAARTNGYKVHVIIARYSLAATPVFQEFVFAGSLDPRTVTIARRISPTSESRRRETVTCEISPKERLDFFLRDVQWAETDMETDIRPFWLCVVAEPGVENSALDYFKYIPSILSSIIIDWKPTVTFIDGNGDEVLFTYTYPTGSYVHNLAYGSHPLSHKRPYPGDLRDLVGTGPWPGGNWAITLTSALNKLCEAVDIVWDGNYPTTYFRKSYFDNTGKFYVDDGEVTPEELRLNWNYVFGYNPGEFSTSQTFKSPITFDGDMTVLDFLKYVAAGLMCKLDMSDFDASGRPIIRFIRIGQEIGTFPIDELDVLEDSQVTEDAIATNNDGVEISRRGFKGSVICPANARNPAKIEIPFAPYAIGYETTPSFDASRIMPNAKLKAIEQWRCGHRLSPDGTSAEEAGVPLNPDGWGVGGHWFSRDTDTALRHFPETHEWDVDGNPRLYDNANETVYQAGGWAGNYPVHAVYEKDPADLTDLEKRERQRNPCISYALHFGRYIRGERRKLSIKFRGCVAPTWLSIANGQTFDYTPVDTAITYVVVSIERDLDNDELTIEAEEQAPPELLLTYKEVGDINEGNGSLGGQGGGGGDTSTRDETLHVWTKRTVKFYSLGVSVKEMEMTTHEFYDPINERIVVQIGIPLPYDEVSPEPYGQVSEYKFHYQGTESGNVEIVGISATGVPDYWASAEVMYKHDGVADTDVNYRLLTKWWSEDQGDFIVQRPLQAAAVKPRIYVAGRFEIDTSAAAWGAFNWKTILSADWPLSNLDCKTDIDIGYLGASAVLPTLAASGVNAISITWGARYKPVTIMCQAWGFNALDTPGAGTSSHAWQLGANPARNQQPTVNGVEISFWLNNIVAGAYNHITKAAYTDIDAEAALDIVVVEFWGELEVVGDSA